jgi:ABC-type protease/lipase transport system fused ATPase/permease subunit
MKKIITHIDMILVLVLFVLNGTSVIKLRNNTQNTRKSIKDIDVITNFIISAMLKAFILMNKVNFIEFFFKFIFYLKFINLFDRYN